MHKIMSYESYNEDEDEDEDPSCHVPCCQINVRFRLSVISVMSDVVRKEASIGGSGVHTSKTVGR